MECAEVDRPHRELKERRMTMQEQDEVHRCAFMKRTVYKDLYISVTSLHYPGSFRQIMMSAYWM